MRGRGVAAQFDSVAAARAALADGAIAVTGALGFDTSSLAALTVPESWEHGPAPAASAPIARHAVESSVTPGPLHRDRIRTALRAIDAGTVQKVVLAREASWTFDEPLGPDALVGAFAQIGTRAAIFSCSLDAAPGYAGRRLVGASPELLVKRTGRIVSCHPYAGSVPRAVDPDDDAAAAQSLLDSAKDLAEHAFVVDDLRTRLAPLCRELDVPERPALTSTGELWHLATPLRGVLADPSITALDLAALLSPTPAVCGTPTEVAAALIEESEGPRGFYGGTVGWCDAKGDGEWLVSIRCLELGADRRSVRSWAGGGIVAGSDPDAEVAETDAKFGTVRRALGLVAQS